MALLGSWITDLVLVFAIFFAILYFFVTANYNYWKKINVPYVKPSFPFGNFGKTFTGRIGFAQVFDEFYPFVKKHGYAGIYNVREPVLVVADPELIKHFITKDFNSFHDRGIPYDEENDPFSANLFNLAGNRWKALRAKLSPTFTSGKIKGMFPLIQECSDNLKKCIDRDTEKNNGSLEMRDLLVRYTTDVIGTCAFGINCNSLIDPNAEFHKMGREVFRSNISNLVRFVLITVFPFLAKYFTFKSLFSKTTNFFTTLMDRTLKHRKSNNVVRNDFVQLMMKILDEQTDGEVFNQDILTAQAFLFFLAGLDNVANNIGFCLHQLALDLDLQERLYEEITSVLENNDGKMSYEALGKMDTVCRTIDEGLRMYTPAGVLMRKQTEEKYIIPGTDVELRKGVAVMIPTQCIHYDEEYFPNPKKFDPDRFTEEEKAQRHPYVYLPFGEGPRFCIASRFAQLEMRLCLAELLRQYQFSIAPETDTSLKMDVKAFGPTPANGFWLRATARSHDLSRRNSII